MTTPVLRLSWRTGSYAEAQNCVELADSDPNKVMVRDTKARSRGTVTFLRDTWAIFVQHVKRT
ncbi:DUF397 domain-containing protein [Streptomyces sp. NPDC057238]|uniref:DUF397 domain-containing protein n=1 Tax=unclassified Streptomyces TaxID=2593676 RepID=UPI00362AFDA4